jgi:hypothetical protein
MKNFNCQTLKHIGMWSLSQTPVSAFAGKTQPSIRSYNDEGLPGSFIEGDGYA